MTLNFTYHRYEGISLKLRQNGTNMAQGKHGDKVGFTKRAQRVTSNKNMLRSKLEETYNGNERYANNISRKEEG